MWKKKSGAKKKKKKEKKSDAESGEEREYGTIAHKGDKICCQLLAMVCGPVVPPYTGPLNGSLAPSSPTLRSW